MTSDAAYAQFEQARLKIPPDKPLAVQQWRGLIAVNYPARAFGITRHLPFDEARKKCPDLICVHVATYAQGDSETEAKYHENPKPETHKVESVKILKIFSESCPTIEKASIDEAFLDFSIPVRDILCSRYDLPTLEALQESSSKISLDDPLPQPPRLDWDKLLEPSQTNIVPLDPDSDHSDTWTDIALLIGSELMAHCRQEVFDQLGYTCSAGIATNKVNYDLSQLTTTDLVELQLKPSSLSSTIKFEIATWHVQQMLAKLCSAYKKPNAQTVLRPAAVRDFLRPFEVSKVRFLGGKLGQLVTELISSTIAEPDLKACVLSEVWKIPLSQLQASLGEQTGMWVWETVRGVDRSEVETKTHVKSMMSSKNFRPSISTWTQGLHWLRILARDLFARLKEARETTPGIWPKVIVMHKRDGSQNSFAKQIAFPFTAQLTDEYIFLLGQKLLQEFSVRQADQTFHLGTITSLALAFQTLERIESGQRGIQGFFAPQKIDLASNRPHLKPPAPGQQASHPEDTAHSAAFETDPIARPSKDIQSLSSLPNNVPKLDPPVNKRQRTGTLDGFAGAVNGPPSRDCSKTKDDASGVSEPAKEQRSFKFVCPRCDEMIALDAGMYAPNDDENGDEEEQKRREFLRLKNLHLDHHFAHDLWAQENRPASSSLHPHPRPNLPPSKPTNCSHNNHKNITASSSSSSDAAAAPFPRPTGNANRLIHDFFKPSSAAHLAHNPQPKKRKK
ncbi:hypothetical protein VP01_19g9 [Puccinia sorghi]|uniref:DNA polymerase eta n=1 Tax=Puccinia sorghi TaxID=27349 RepID=A0A0L6VBB3_9BASI|nr:hypothetical protein VP01_19g9 [Puccinia sorghi]